MTEMQGDGLAVNQLAAIDIGSNAIRLLIQNIVPDSPTPKFIKACFLRLPIRLGADVFVKKRISSQNEALIIKAMKAFQLVMEIHGVADYRAFATSAMRTASNGQAIAEKVKRETGISIEIIDGQQEASILFGADTQRYLEPAAKQLFIDVGGGSTELMLLSGAEVVAGRSFEIGTIRFLQGQISREIWRDMRTWVTELTRDHKGITMVGSGGNINKLFKMSGKKVGTPLTYGYVYGQYKSLQKLSYAARIKSLQLNPDRADVILPAAKIYSSVMRWAGFASLYVPKIGLADGMIRRLYFKDI